jgi:hypothetical protein
MLDLSDKPRSEVVDDIPAATVRVRRLPLTIRTACSNIGCTYAGRSSLTRIWASPDIWNLSIEPCATGDHRPFGS